MADQKRGMAKGSVPPQSKPQSFVTVAVIRGLQADLDAHLHPSPPSASEEDVVPPEAGAADEEITPVG